MGVKHLACAMVLVAGLVALAEPVVALEVGELQAVPGGYPPYTFRLAIIASPGGSSGTPAVTVRQPQDALSFVRNNHVELRLRALSDVELEVTQGSQTLNRLLLKSELLAARARLGTTPAPPRPPSTLDKDGATPPSTAATYSTSDRAVLEHEMHGIRQEVHSLVGRVIPWEDAATPPWHTNYGTAALVFTLVLWAVFIAGVTALVAGYLMHRSAVDGERQRRRALVASIRQARGELTSGAPALHGARHGQRFGDRHESWQPVTRLRRLWVSQNTQRLILVQGGPVRTMPPRNKRQPTPRLWRGYPGLR
ncbi:MAG TPA: hypothetical protein VLK82_12520 [Candidatus Tectomicrobia bacterium]|nr:hypothetical protein [Candidatus Tectomicrobia bacterium]